MVLPRNARVAVVDNEPDEVADLLSVLAKEGVSTLFYKGPSAFPAAPLIGIRLLFLDLELAGLENANEKTKASAAAANLKKLIGPDNGPLLVVLWTNHAEVVDLAKQYMLQAVKLPLFVVPIDKADCKEGKFFVVEKIRGQIAEMLAQSSADCVGLYVNWENAVFDSTVKLSARLSGVADGNGDKWSEIMSRAFYKLYEANSGENTLFSFRDQFLSACEPYGKSLSNEIGVVLHKSDFDVSRRFKLNATKLSDDDEQKLAGRINSLLFYDQESVDSESPGTVYIVEAKSRHSNILKALAADFFNSIKSEVLKSKDVSLCKIIITPACDCAQKKPFCPIVVTKKMRETRKLRTKFDRIVWAILVKHGAFKIEGKKSRCYTLENFEYRGAYYDLLIGLDAMGIEIVKKYKGRQKRLFSLTAQVLADLQSKASNQLNRIGICSVGAKK